MVTLVTLIGLATLFSRFYRKPGPEEAIVRTGVRGLNVCTGNGMVVIPLIQEAHVMDMSVKRIEISREGEDGLICQDNIRADIKVAFFVRVNNATEDIKAVAEMLNPQRASDINQLRELFEAKFSEALKTVGKQFDFVSLYTDRDNFRDKIIAEIGTDLNGYRLDNCHIDYLEQTRLEMLNPHNILDAEGIKKITELTTVENMARNHFEVEEAKTIKKQNVERDETLYELERQRVEAEQKQQREIAEITAREHAEAAKVQEEQRLKAEAARIASEEEIKVRDENKQRQIIVAMRNKERTDKVEIERVEKDRLLEATERERVVGLADIEKEKAIEIEKRNIQEVIRERVAVERSVVEEQENIKNTQEFMGVDRLKRVTVTTAEATAQEQLVKQVKAAEASKQSAEFQAEEVVVEAEGQRAAAEKQMQATKMLAEAKTADHAAIGLGDAEVILAKADAKEKDGTAEAAVIQRKAVATAKGEEAKAVAVEKLGTAEATVMQQKFSSEANGIEEKANAMKLFDEVGKEHEEFKLRLNKDKDIEIAAIVAQEHIAEAQSNIVGEALKSARIDIVGGETTFFDQIVSAVKGGKAVDRFVNNSDVLTDVKGAFFNGKPENFRESLKGFVSQFGMNFEDVKDMSVAALIGKMLLQADDAESKNSLQGLLKTIRGAGLAEKRVAMLGVTASAAAD
ncbi:MAG: flotillin family protein [Planctomycetaceae bacterium]|nr:flotillin family protein [Planctomycetaceae bacterium]MBT6157499.1 flotillin family protein [Planctomycetaceae bacterium]MBT6486086.1 flotillin family protein [Planctomycetaceae bacterium]MBT6496747.1 flotillin family protein [Planctomycetaceae bacterium]